MVDWSGWHQLNMGKVNFNSSEGKNLNIVLVLPRYLSLVTTKNHDSIWF